MQLWWSRVTGSTEQAGNLVCYACHTCQHSALTYMVIEPVMHRSCCATTAAPGCRLCLARTQLAAA